MILRTTLVAGAAFSTLAGIGFADVVAKSGYGLGGNVVDNFAVTAE